MSATNEFMGILHEKTARLLLDKIESGEATSSDVANIIRFLKDSNIEAVAVKGTPMGDLLDGLDVANMIRLQDKIGSR